MHVCNVHMHVYECEGIQVQCTCMYVHVYEHVHVYECMYVQRACIVYMCNVHVCGGAHIHKKCACTWMYVRQCTYIHVSVHASMCACFLCTFVRQIPTLVGDSMATDFSRSRLLREPFQWNLSAAVSSMTFKLFQTSAEDDDRPITPDNHFGSPFTGRSPIRSRRSELKVPEPRDVPEINDGFSSPDSVVLADVGKTSSTNLRTFFWNGNKKAEILPWILI